MQRLAVVDLNTSRMNPRIVPGLPGERGTHGCQSNMSRAFLVRSPEHRPTWWAQANDVFCCSPIPSKRTFWKPLGKMCWQKKRTNCWPDSWADLYFFWPLGLTAILNSLKKRTRCSFIFARRVQMHKFWLDWKPGVRQKVFAKGRLGIVWESNAICFASRTSLPSGQNKSSLCQHFFQRAVIIGLQAAPQTGHNKSRNLLWLQ